MQLSRRQLLKGLGTIALVSLLRRPAPAGAAPTGPLAVQLGWISNVEYAGEYVADNKGYYLAEGIRPEFRSGGPEVDGISQLVSGKAFATLNNLVGVAHSVSNGARLKIVAATFQKDPLTIISLPKNPIRTPKEMVGKRVGVSPVQYLFFTAFCAINRIDPKSLTIVPAGFDPAPLVTGQVDGFVSFMTNQPMQLAERGIQTEALVWADFGWNQFTNCFVVREDVLTDIGKRDQLVKLLRGTVKGWQDVISDPENAAKLMVKLFGDRFGLKESLQIKSANAEIPFILTAETKRNGLLTMSENAIAACIDCTRQAGVDLDRKIFDTGPVEEAIQGIRHG